MKILKIIYINESFRDRERERRKYKYTSKAISTKKYYFQYYLVINLNSILDLRISHFISLIFSCFRFLSPSLYFNCDLFILNGCHKIIKINKNCETFSFSLPIPNNSKKTTTKSMILKAE